MNISRLDINYFMQGMMIIISNLDKSYLYKFRDVTDKDRTHKTQKRPSDWRTSNNIQKFEGTLHPASKLRHGTGVYHYDNSFFTYEGEYLNGRKNGQGSLKMKDGTVINGTFKDD